ncbi:MAG: glutamate 5-kinase [Clostridiales bacterium]|nr:glutamate 5-kinase [Clostridiales bacterium]
MNKIIGRELLNNCNRIVVKVGTTTLTYDNGKLNLQRVSKLAWVLSDLKSQGKEIALVSSGAITVGTERLGLTKRPKDIKGKQAASAVGQAVLMQIYQNLFLEYNQQVAQILLTKDIIDNPVRKENARNTFFELFKLGVIPIINENDTVSIDELEFSDNDTLSSYVACLIDCDLLIILSDIEGLYEEDPKKNPNAHKIDIINKIDQNIYDIAGGPLSEHGTGGMHTKISAAQRATQAGIKTIVASGSEPNIIFKILAGDNIGTLFV